MVAQGSAAQLPDVRVAVLALGARPPGAAIGPADAVAADLAVAAVDAHAAGHAGAVRGRTCRRCSAGRRRGWSRIARPGRPSPRSRRARRRRSRAPGSWCTRRCRSGCRPGRSPPRSGRRSPGWASQRKPGWQGVRTHSAKRHRPSRHRRSAGQGGSPAPPAAGHALAVGAALAGRAGGAVVDLAVAVVVQAVAQLGGRGPRPPSQTKRAPPGVAGSGRQTLVPGRHSPRMGVPSGSPGAGQGPGGLMPSSVLPSQSSSRALQVSARGSTPPSQRLAPPRQVSMPGRQMPTLDPQAGGRGQVGVDGVLVGDAVAVVVHAVAQLGLGALRLLAHHHAGLAAPAAGAALAPDGPAGAGHVVHGAVAVVVDGVAGLVGRPHPAHAAEHAVHAHLHARGAGPLAGSDIARPAGVAHPEALVDLAVAVVVHAVAGQLGAGGHRALAARRTARRCR